MRNGNEEQQQQAKNGMSETKETNKKASAKQSIDIITVNIITVFMYLVSPALNY